MTSLVIGYGSIGRRHARLLAERGNVAVLTRQSEVEHPAFRDLAQALDVASPDYVVVANETARHGETVEALAEAGYRGRLLVEKPIALEPSRHDLSAFSFAAVAYNLRFHPVVAELRRLIAGKELLSLSVACGQHLADWRPGRDFRQTYSARRADGGGVLRDLSHELDLLLWLAGPCARVAATGGNLGALEIDADEAWSCIATMRSGAIADLRVNYLERPARREIIAITRDATIRADVVAGLLQVDGAPRAVSVERDQTYREMHDAMLRLDGSVLCSVPEAEAVVRLVDSIERAAARKAWIEC